MPGGARWETRCHGLDAGGSGLTWEQGQGARPGRAAAGGPRSGRVVLPPPARSPQTARGSSSWGRGTERGRADAPPPGARRLQLSTTHRPYAWAAFPEVCHLLTVT